MDKVGNGQFNNLIQRKFWARKRAFSHQDYYTFAASEVSDFIIDPTAYTGNGKVLVNPLVVVATSGPILIDFYRGLILNDGGTELFTYNRRAGGPAPQSIIRRNPDIADLGTRFAGGLVPATGVAPASSTGSSNNTIQTLPLELDPTTMVSARITNTDGNDTFVFIIVQWFEE